MTLRDKVATVDMVDPDSVFNCYVQLEKPLAVKNARLAIISEAWGRLMAAFLGNPNRQKRSYIADPSRQYRQFADLHFSLVELCFERKPQLVS